MATAALQRTGAEPLDLWERGVGLDRWARDDALLAAGGGEAPRGLGARNVAMLRLREALFGASWPLRAACPACGEECGFAVGAGALADGIAATPIGDEAGARPATVDDLRAVATAADRGEAGRLLLRRCGVAAEEPGAAALLERLDPGAVVTLVLDCPACGHGWSAPLDVGEALWAELRHMAEAQLLEVDALARLYGWTEAEVLALSPTRRAAYLQLAGAA